MAREWNQGLFVPKNPKKYIGKNIDKITYRSAWELTVMRLCDEHPNITYWASEFEPIMYRNPFNGKWKPYVPDFLIIYQDKNGKVHGEVVEVKPKKQIHKEYAKSRRDQILVEVNHAKWFACMQWCKRKGLKFRIITEEDLYAQKPSSSKRRK